MVLAGNTDSELVQSGKVTCPIFYQLLELRKQGVLKTFYPQMGLIHNIKVMGIISLDILLDYSNRNHLRTQACVSH